MDSADKEIIRLNSDYPLLKKLPEEKQEDSIRKMIVAACAFLGIKNLPDKLTAPFIIRFIKTNFSSLSAEAMVQAFELNALGSFETEKKKRHEHYQNFSIEFVSDVLGDYLMMKRKAVNDFKQLTAPTDADPQESDESVYNWLLSYLEKNKAMPTICNWNKVYCHMETSGMIPESNDWKREYFESIKKIVENEVALEKLTLVSSIDRMNAEKPLSKESLVLRCRKEYVIMKMIAKEKSKAA